MSSSSEDSRLTAMQVKLSVTKAVIGADRRVAADALERVVHRLHLLQR